MASRDGSQPAAPAERSARTIELAEWEHEKIAAFKQGAIDYARNLPDWAKVQLHQKPFVPLVDAARELVPIYLRDLAAIVELLDLPVGTSVLDVACGPGWISDALYRFGYRVTGIDLAPDLLAVARQRIDAVERPPLGHDPSWAEFLAVDIETARLERRFDAAILYDCLHHFADARGALENIRSMLSRHGKLLIKEGVKPPAGSEDERELLKESETYQVLESPFEPQALIDLLGSAGFAQITRLVPGEPFAPAGEGRWQKVRRALRPPGGREVNFIVCSASAEAAPIPLDRGLAFRASLELLAQESRPDGLALRVRVTNDGRAVWTRGDEKRTGTVCVGCRLRDADGRVVEEFGGRSGIPSDLAPGESAELALLYRWIDAPAGATTLTVDVSRQGECWLGELGSPVLRLDLPPRP